MEGSTHLLVTRVILGWFGGGECVWDGVEGAVVVEARCSHRMHGRTAFPSPLGLLLLAESLRTPVDDSQTWNNKNRAQPMPYL